MTTPAKGAAKEAPEEREFLEPPDSSQAARTERARNLSVDWELPKAVLSKRDQARENNRGVTPLVAGRRDYGAESLVRKLLPGEELLHVTSRTGE